ncbi:hypothetical protein ACIQZB_43485 [Streptomyces sp. NPDC097727]|uniref:hypothetical protein n=1 Tax=Streptomyces sp. NPDC097727 TaxID=3366092 RepID=UPI00382E4E0A
MVLKPFVIAIRPDDLECLNGVVSLGALAEADWLRKEREREGVALLRGRALSEARRRIRTERARLRTSGVLLGTRDLVVAQAIGAELKARGWDMPYEPVPHDARGIPGRPVGTSPRHYEKDEDGEPALTGRMPVRLPADLAEQMLRALHWEMAPIVAALWEWKDRWGDGPTVILKEAERNGLGGSFLAHWIAGTAPRANADAILERAQLQAQTVTTGDVIRAAVQRAI